MNAIARGNILSSATRSNECLKNQHSVCSFGSYLGIDLVHIIIYPGGGGVPQDGPVYVCLSVVVINFLA